MKRTNLIVTAVLVAVLVVLPTFSSLINLYIDWLFFTETGYTGVFSKTMTTQIASGVFFGLLFLGFALVNLVIAKRILILPPTGLANLSFSFLKKDDDS